MVSLDLGGHNPGKRDLEVLGARLPPKAPGRNRNCFVGAAVELKQSTDTKS